MAVRVTHIITDLDIGGAETTLAKLVGAYDRDRFEMDVISLTDIGQVGREIENTGTRVTALGMHPGRISLFDILRLQRTLLKSRPDIVQTWLYHSDFIGGIAARLAGKPVVWSIRSLMSDPTRVKRSTLATRRICAALSHRIPTRIIACAAEAARLHISLGYAAGKMVVIPNGYDLDVYRPDSDARLSVRRELEISDSSSLVGLVGRFDPQKDHRTFLEACKQVSNSHPGTHFLLCGKDIAQENLCLSEWINELGLRSQVHLLGPRRDTPRIFASLDVAVLSSISEAFPNVVAEAMACGVPCVVTDVGDAAIIVGDTGFVVPPRRPELLAEACRKLLEAPNAGLRVSTRERIRTEFSLQSITARYEALYEEVREQCAD